MKFQERFSIEELAKRWNVSIDTVTQKVQARKFMEVIIADRDGLPTKDSYSFFGLEDLIENKEFMAQMEQLAAKPGFYEESFAPERRWWDEAYTVYIPTEAVEQFEKENGLTPDHTSAPPANTDFKWIHSQELRLAIECYYDLYGKNKIEPRGSSHKAQILKWINSHPKGKRLAQETKNRIATVVNPNKAGGAPKT